MSESLLFNIQHSISGKRWEGRPYHEGTALRLAQSLNVPEIVGRLLSSRGLDLETANLFLNPSLRATLPDPLHLREMDLAVACLARALSERKKIAVFGDYDVDGATSTAVLYRFFLALGVSLRIYIPDRIEEGYGPTLQAFEYLKKEDVAVVLTVDCGTTAYEALEHAQTLGIEVVVLDHHAASPKLPPAAALVNPNRLDETSPFKTLAAVGVTFLFVVALNRHLRQQGWYTPSCPEPDLRELLDLVALGTVCDVMPLTGLNRVYVAQGLKVMARRQNCGLKALAEVGGLQSEPTAYHLGFVLGPRINAGGRVGEASLGARLLCTNDPFQAYQMAQQLDAYNQQRKVVEEEILTQALLQAEDQPQGIILVKGLGWHPGVIGIVAGRLKERYQRPVCVVALDEKGIGKGSGRSIPGVDLGTMMHAACQNKLLLAGGGHAMAAGFTLDSKYLEEFHHFLNQKFSEMAFSPLPTLTLDGALTLRSASQEFISFLEQLAPYGAGNPTPRFVFNHVRLLHSECVAQHHLRCTLGQMDGQRLTGMAFRVNDTPLAQFLRHKVGETIHIAGTLRSETWQGKSRIQLTIEDAAEPL